MNLNFTAMNIEYPRKLKTVSDINMFKTILIGKRDRSKRI